MQRLRSNSRAYLIRRRDKKKSSSSSSNDDHHHHHHHHHDGSLDSDDRDEHDDHHDSKAEKRERVSSALVEDTVVTVGALAAEQIPLHMAVTREDVSKVQLILSSTKKVQQILNVQDQSGWTALHCAAANGNLDICELLLQHKADASICTLDGTLPLQYLVRLMPKSVERGEQWARVLTAVVEQMADIDLANRYGETALHSAVLRSNDAAAEFLLTLGADPNKTNRDGETPLHYAVRMRRAALLTRLLEFDADPNLLSNAKTSPYDVAVRLKDTEALRVFASFNIRRTGEGVAGEALEAAKAEEKRIQIEHLTSQVLRDWKRVHYSADAALRAREVASSKHDADDDIEIKRHNAAAAALRQQQRRPDRVATEDDDTLYSVNDDLSAGFDSEEDYTDMMQRASDDRGGRGRRGTASSSTSSGSVRAPGGGRRARGSDDDGGDDGVVDDDDDVDFLKKVWALDADDEEAKVKRIGDSLLMGDLLGKGAFGRVFRAVDCASGEFVAAKEFLWKRVLADAHTASDVEAALAIFLRELDILQRLSHDNIVRCIGWHNVRHGLYLVLEYVEGGSLADLVRRFGPLPESLVASYISQILDGLAYLHRQGIGHRDVKYV
jgi:ankyrin repeat protein